VRVHHRLRCADPRCLRGLVHRGERPSRAQLPPERDRDRRRGARDRRPVRAARPAAQAVRRPGTPAVTAPRAAVVAGWAVRMWGRGLARTFRTTPRLIGVGAIIGLAVAVLVGGALAALTGSQLGGGLPAELTQRILGTAFAGAAMIATAVAVV